MNAKSLFKYTALLTTFVFNLANASSMEGVNIKVYTTKNYPIIDAHLAHKVYRMDIQEDIQKQLQDFMIKDDPIFNKLQQKAVKLQKQSNQSSKKEFNNTLKEMGLYLRKKMNTPQMIAKIKPQLEKSVKELTEGVVNAFRRGIKKVPAMLFTVDGKEAVIYGETNVSRAIELFNHSKFKQEIDRLRKQKTLTY